MMPYRSTQFLLTPLRVCGLAATLTATVFLATAGWAGSIKLITYYPAPEASYDRITLIPQNINPASSCTIGTLAADSSPSNLLYCRNNGSGVGVWGALNSVWTQTNDYIYPTNTVDPPVLVPLTFAGYSGLPICSASPLCVPCVPNPKLGMLCPDVLLPAWCYCANSEQLGSEDSIFVGIGTSAPDFKLTLENDGGILAMGTYGSGSTFPGFDCLDVNQTCPAPTLHWSPRHASFHAGGYTTVGSPDDTYIVNYSTAFGLINIDDASPGVVNTSTTSSGRNNSANEDYSVIAGGSDNIINGDYATITGGNNNNILDIADYSVISGGPNNTTMGTHSTISGGYNNTTIGTHQTISGGDTNNILGLANYSTISGGKNNIINNAASSYSFIGGGEANTVSNGTYGVIGGGQANTLFGTHAYIGGGFENINQVSFPSPAIGDYSVIGGGNANNALGDWSVITGGSSNTARGNYSNVLGGSTNNVSGTSSVIAGGSNNTNSGNYSVVAGGQSNTNAGDYSWVGGRGMNLTANADRTFVWGYSDTVVNIVTPDAFILAPGTNGAGMSQPKLSIGETEPTAILNITAAAIDTSDLLAITSTSGASVGNILIVKNDGSIGIGDNIPANPLDFGAQASGARLDSSGIFQTISSRELKNNIKPLDATKAIETLKELKPVTYNYKVNKNEHHVGFIAEEVPDMVAEEGRKSVDPMNVTAILTSVLKDQQKTIDQQDEVLKTLEEELQDLRTNVPNR